MPSIKNIVFDFGGVIADLSRETAVEKWHALGFADADRVLSVYQQTGIFLDFEEGRLSPKDFCLELSALIGKRIDEARCKEAWCAFVAGVPAYKLAELDALRKTHRVFILSNTNPYIARWMRSGAFTPEGRALSDFAEKLYTSCEIGICKPNPQAFRFVLDDAKIRAEDTLFVDDGEENVAQARAMGFTVYRPRNGEDWRAEVSAILGAAG